MTAIPVWLLGKHLSTVTVNPQSVASDGTLADTGDTTLVTVCKNVRVSGDFMTEDIRPVANQQAHNVRTGVDSTLTMTILLKVKNTSPAVVSNPLATISAFASPANTEVYKITVTRGGNTWTFYGTMESLEDGVEEFGQNVCTVSWKQVDTGATAPLAYT